GITSDLILRPYAYLETLTWIFKRLGQDHISWKFAREYSKRVAKKLPKIIESFKPNIVISYDTIKVPPSDKFKYIVICPMSHPAAVKKSLLQSKELFPNWPELEDEIPLGINDTANFADRIVLLSEFAKQTYTCQGFEASKLEVIHVGPVNGNKDFRLPNYKKGSVLRILFLGRMTRVKGVEALAELSHYLNPLNFKISLVGQCSPIIARYIREISNGTVLTLFENPQPKDISKHFAESDIFALPSFNEGFNISSLEAMSYGLIPILSKNTGVSEILMNTSLADFIIDPGSVEDLGKCIDYLFKLEQNDFNELAKISFNLAKDYSFDRFSEIFVEMMFKELSR
ncbi:MAG: glycosyltransferase, partial [Actinobacteria bacterium]|nr:glycosyltransferase [Actinomycetota bacterium]